MEKSPDNNSAFARSSAGPTAPPAAISARNAAKNAAGFDATTKFAESEHPPLVHPFGDGRNNYRNPQADLLAHMVNASRHAHWLNPEPRHLWGSGDSAVPRYEDVITMHECRSAKQLAAVIDQLLPV